MDTVNNLSPVVLSRTITAYPRKLSATFVPSGDVIISWILPLLNKTVSVDPFRATRRTTLPLQTIRLSPATCTAERSA